MLDFEAHWSDLLENHKNLIASVNKKVSFQVGDIALSKGYDILPLTKDDISITTNTDGACHCLNPQDSACGHCNCRLTTSNEQMASTMADSITRALATPTSRRAPVQSNQAGPAYAAPPIRQFCEFSIDYSATEPHPVPRAPHIPEPSQSYRLAGQPASLYPGIPSIFSAAGFVATRPAAGKGCRPLH